MREYFVKLVHDSNLFAKCTKETKSFFFLLHDHLLEIRDFPVSWKDGNESEPVALFKKSLLSFT